MFFPTYFMPGKTRNSLHNFWAIFLTETLKSVLVLRVYCREGEGEYTYFPKMPNDSFKVIEWFSIISSICCGFKQLFFIALDQNWNKVNNYKDMFISSLRSVIQMFV